MKLSIKKMALIVVVVLFGGISITMLSGIWTTETTKIPATYVEGDFEGEYNPEDIRGSYTFNEVSTLFDIPLDVLYQAFGIPADTDGDIFKSKDLETLYEDQEVEIGNGSVQVFVALYKGLPIALDDSYLPSSAVEILKALPTEWTEEQLAYFDAYSVILSEPTASIDSEASDVFLSEDATSESSSDESVDSATTEDAVATEEEEPLIKGTTTFQQVLDAGITQEQIESVIGADLPPTNQPIKDYCLSVGLSFSEVKTALTDLLP